MHLHNLFLKPKMSGAEHIERAQEGFCSSLSIYVIRKSTVQSESGGEILAPPLDLWEWKLSPNWQANESAIRNDP